MNIIKEHTLAGMFYSDNAGELTREINGFLADVFTPYPVPKAIIAPHAGLRFSGAVAASAYACLAKAKDKIKKVVLLGPAHRYPFSGVGITKADCYTTPIGKIKIDCNVSNKLLLLPQVKVVEQAYYQENSIEVHLPFFQILLNDFELVPVLTGNVAPLEVAEVLDELWGGEETLVVVSSDLSHYHNYETALQKDKKTAFEILSLNPEAIAHEDACGSLAIKALLLCAKENNLKVTEIDLKNSGDTGGDKDRVVGYGAFHLGSKGTD